MLDASGRGTPARVVMCRSGASARGLPGARRRAMLAHRPAPAAHGHTRSCPVPDLVHQHLSKEGGRTGDLVMHAGDPGCGAGLLFRRERICGNGQSVCGHVCAPGWAMDIGWVLDLCSHDGAACPITRLRPRHPKHLFASTKPFLEDTRSCCAWTLQGLPVHRTRKHSSQVQLLPLPLNNRLRCFPVRRTTLKTADCWVSFATNQRDQEHLTGTSGRR